MNIDELGLTLTVPEAAKLLGISRNSAYSAARRGQLPAVRVGHRLIIPTGRLLALLGYEATATHRADEQETAGGDADDR